MNKVHHSSQTASCLSTEGRPKGVVNMTRIVDIVDNRAGDGLVAEHGLSLLIEHAAERILFDTGAGAALVPNAHALGVDLNQVTHVVLSHSHYDHTGGLAAFRPTCPICVGGGIEVPSFSRQPEKPIHALGMSAESLSVLSSGKVMTTSGVASVSEGVRLFGPIPRTDSLEHVRGFYYDEECTRPSRVTEEQALLTDDGVLVTGCCHAGIVNTVEYVRSLAPEIRIRAIVGGLHLCWASEDQIVRVAEYLNRMGLEQLVLLHCTGEAASAYLMRNMQCSVSVGASGEVWEYAHSAG